MLIDYLTDSLNIFNIIRNQRGMDQRTETKMENLKRRKKRMINQKKLTKIKRNK